MEDYSDPFIINTNKILEKLNNLDDRFICIENDFNRLKWKLDDIKNSISSKAVSEEVKSKQVLSKSTSITKNK